MLDREEGEIEGKKSGKKGRLRRRICLEDERDGKKED